LESNLQYAGSKTFEDKYLKLARERLDRGPRALIPPEEDPILKDMK